MRAVQPRAYALGYSMPPLTGLLRTVELEKDFVNDLLTQDTNGASPQPDDACFRGFTAVQELDSFTPDFRLQDF